MKFLLTLCLLFAAACMASGAVQGSDFYTRRQYNPGQYYENAREMYNRRRYQDALHGKYNPQVAPQKARIIEQNFEPIREDGSYGYRYITENGIYNEAHGTAISLKNGDKIQSVQGSYSFFTPEGIRVTTRYVADENGYRPVVTYDGFNMNQFRRSQRAASDEIKK